jgi:hypothetical protein
MTRKLARLLLPAAVAALGLLITQGAVAGKTPNPAKAAPMKSGTYYAKGVPLCKAPKPGYRQCFAMKRVLVKKGSAGAKAFTVNTTPTPGPAGGFTPQELATAYGYPFVASGTGTSTKVAIVDAYNDPNIEADLQSFDQHYGLGICTRANACLNVVNQTGGACLANGTGCPAADAGWAGEETLDVQAVRSVCTSCKIILVEANSNSNADLATGVNEAYALGARIISNSYGGPETTDPSNSAYNHPGAIITASTGDNGWFGWDYMNQIGGTPDNMPSSPATLNTVVAVGGTSLNLAQNGTRASETVWNNNGPADYYGWNLGLTGATGGGCSTLFGARGWQTHVPGWAATPCGTKRLAADISADADPLTGFDIYDSYGSTGWQTIGGTSLSSPLVAALWARAGVPPSTVSYPAVLPYGHLKDGSAYDVTTGGNGYCGGLTVGQCLGGASGPVNPNSLGYGMIDCDYSNMLQPGTPATGVGQCDAAPGFDGPSGVGTPKGLNVFKQVAFAKITAPATVTHGVLASFSGASADPYPGGAVTLYSWNWGDGVTQTATTASVSHTYAAAGTKTVTLTVKDNYGATSTVSKIVTVG